MPDTVTPGAVSSQLTEIGKGALKGNKKITKVTLGKNVTTIGAEAFSDCSALTELTLPKNTKTLGKKFINKCNKKMKLTIKNTKMTKSTVKAGAFSGMTNKSSVTIIVPKGMNKTYKTLFQSKGLGAKVTVKASTK